MKINSDNPSGLTGATDPLGRTPNQAATAAKTAPAPAPKEQLTLSSDALKLQAAANQPPAVRSDLVDKMRTLLNEGKVGNDAEALADSIIDDLLNQS